MSFDFSDLFVDAYDNIFAFCNINSNMPGHLNFSYTGLKMDPLIGSSIESIKKRDALHLFLAIYLFLILFTRNEKVFTVVLQFSYRITDIIHRQMGSIFL